MPQKYCDKSTFAPVNPFIQCNCVLCLTDQMSASMCICTNNIYLLYKGGTTLADNPSILSNPAVFLDALASLKTMFKIK